MPIKISDSTGYATYSDMAKGITYAADRGVRVINVSFGGRTSSSTLQNAVTYAWQKMQSSLPQPETTVAVRFLILQLANMPWLYRQLFLMTLLQASQITEIQFLFLLPEKAFTQRQEVEATDHGTEPLSHLQWLQEWRHLFFRLILF